MVPGMVHSLRPLLAISREPGIARFDLSSLGTLTPIEDPPSMLLRASRAAPHATAQPLRSLPPRLSPVHLPWALRLP